jgi:hypothetical protein
MKIALIVLPCEELPQGKVVLEGLTDEEKEKAFDMLDAELHDTTYNELDRMVDSLRGLNEELQDDLDYYKELIEEYEALGRIVGW